MTYGVSPAYFISKFTDRFTPKDVLRSIPGLRAQGYEAFQVEICRKDALSLWTTSLVDQVSDECLKNGMHVSQFVCHHWMEDFSVASRILSPNEPSRYAAELDLAASFPVCTQLTVPLAKFVFDIMGIKRAGMYQKVYNTLVEHIQQVLKLAKERSLRVALELQPGACISGIEGFLRVWNLFRDVSLGYNFDTGHANASKEQVEIIPFILGDRIFGTHLCDNHGNENLSLAPGDGSIDWGALLEALRETSYDGSYDLEILCPQSEVEATYARGLEYLNAKLLPV